MTRPVRKRRRGIGQCQDCGISPQLTNEDGKCEVCADRHPQLTLGGVK